MKKKLSVVVIALDVFLLLYTIFFYVQQSHLQRTSAILQNSFQEKYWSFDSTNHRRFNAAFGALRKSIEASDRTGHESLSIFLHEQETVGMSFLDMCFDVRDEARNLKFDLEETGQSARRVLVVCLFLVLVDILWLLTRSLIKK